MTMKKDLVSWIKSSSFPADQIILKSSCSSLGKIQGKRKQLIPNQKI